MVLDGSTLPRAVENRFKDFGTSHMGQGIVFTSASAQVIVPGGQMMEVFEFPSASGTGGFPAHSRSASDCSMTSLQVVSAGSNNAGWLSPRISFSTGFASDDEPDVPEFSLNMQGIETAGCADEDSCKRHSGVEAGDQECEFEFSVSHSQEINPVCQGFMLPADELFFKGKLLPLQQTSRTQMVEMLSSDQSGPTEAATTKSRHAHSVHYYASPSPFPFPLATSSPQPVRCPPQETPQYFASSPPFPYPIASLTPQACAQPSSARAFVPLPSPRCRKSAKWKQVLRSLRRAKNEQNLAPADESEDACTSQDSCEGRRPKVLRMFFRGHGHSHGYAKDVDASAECSAEPNSGPDVGTDSRAPESRDDGRRLETTWEVKGADKGAGHARLAHVKLRAADPELMGRSSEGSRPFKCREAREESASAKIKGGPGSPGKRSPGRGSPSRLYVKVAAEKSSSSRSGTVGKIVLKNLERVSSPAKRGPRNKDHFLKGSEKAGSYTASVRVMPVLNVPSVSIKPVFRSANLSSKGRLGDLRNLFCKREASSPSFSPLLGNEKTA